MGRNEQRYCENERRERGREKVLLPPILFTSSLLNQHHTEAHRNRQLPRIEAALRGDPRRFQEVAATIYFLGEGRSPLEEDKSSAREIIASLQLSPQQIKTSKSEAGYK